MTPDEIARHNALVLATAEDALAKTVDRHIEESRAGSAEAQFRLLAIRDFFNASGKTGFDKYVNEKLNPKQDKPKNQRGKNNGKSRQTNLRTAQNHREKTVAADSLDCSSL